MLNSNQPTNQAVWPEICRIPLMCCITVDDRAFRVIAARSWNNLPPDVIALPLLTIFEQQLMMSLICHLVTFDAHV